jgi:hypothetical protein
LNDLVGCCLKRELPRIPYAPDFWAFADAGRALARLHLDYEALEPYPLTWVETDGVPLSYRVDDKMRLSKDKTAVRVNPSLTLAGIPPEAFQYRLGNRSALEWVIDQYQVSEDARSGIRSDPNRPDDPNYIVRLVGQVVRVSVETDCIVNALPDYAGHRRRGETKVTADPATTSIDSHGFVSPRAIRLRVAPSRCNNESMPPRACAGHFHVATLFSRNAWFPRCAAAAALTPASAGAVGLARLRTHSTQFVRCSSSPSGLS